MQIGSSQRVSGRPESGRAISEDERVVGSCYFIARGTERGGNSRHQKPILMMCLVHQKAGRAVDGIWKLTWATLALGSIHPEKPLALIGSTRARKCWGANKFGSPGYSR